jgi:adenosylcobinamide-phosphate synthase
MMEVIILIAAFLLDLAVGDPRRMPHPVRIIGKGISFLEGVIRRIARTERTEKIGGIILALLIIISVFLLTFAMNKIILLCIATGGIITAAGIVTAVVLTSTTIAIRDLIDSSKTVIDSVKAGTIDEARRSLSMIVGRDTERLPDKGILKATIETLAENLSDGIVAPLFYFALGGLPLAMTYKAINTLDSMVGYKNEKYINLGKASARLDDIANYLPARITGVLIVAAIGICRTFSLIVGRTRSSLSTAGNAFAIMIRDGRNHSSPNSGIPEAAMAGGLGIMLGGPSTYGNVLVEKPTIGEEKNSDYHAAAENTLKIVLLASSLGLGVSVLILFLRGLL